MHKSSKKPCHAVSAPKHYQGDGDIVAMRALRSMEEDAPVTPFQAFWWGNAFKYLWRFPYKNGIEDLEKCKQCIDYLIEERTRLDNQSKRKKRKSKKKKCKRG